MSEIHAELQPKEERPLVTFALFAYNQEKYIREAIAGAFAQTYEPLEVILSDDFSSDRTFEIMEEMVAGYEGPHTVIARRSPKNRGLGLHIYDAVNLANGKFIIVAAGDDISLPLRTATLVELMEKEGTQFAASNYNKINDNGTLAELNVKDNYSNHYVWQLVNADYDFFAGGATAGYQLSFLKSALQSAIRTLQEGNLYYEDILFAAYAVAINEKPSVYTKSGLVNYRINPLSLSNFSISKNTLNDEIAVLEREKFRSITRLAVISSILEVSSKHPNLSKKLNKIKILKEKRLSEIEIDANNSILSKRIYVTLRSRNLTEFRISAARILGLKNLARIKYIKKRICRN